MVFLFWENGNYLKANLLKSRDAKLEGAKVRNFDQVSRLLLFPYHIWKNVRTEEILINLIRYECVILKKCRKGTGRLSQVSFLYAKMCEKSSLYTEKSRMKKA